MVSSTLLLVSFVNIQAKTRQITIPASPTIAQMMVLATPRLSSSSVNSSSFFTVSTLLFNAGVHSFRISSIASSRFPALISFIMEFPMFPQSLRAEEYSVYSSSGTTPVCFIISSWEPTSASRFSTVCS